MFARQRSSNERDASHFAVDRSLVQQPPARASSRSDRVAAGEQRDTKCTKTSLSCSSRALSAAPLRGSRDSTSGRLQATSREKNKQSTPPARNASSRMTRIASPSAVSPESAARTAKHNDHTIPGNGVGPPSQIKRERSDLSGKNSERFLSRQSTTVPARSSRSSCEQDSSRKTTASVTPTKKADGSRPTALPTAKGMAKKKVDVAQKLFTPTNTGEAVGLSVGGNSKSSKEKPHASSSQSPPAHTTLTLVKQQSSLSSLLGATASTAAWNGGEVGDVGGGDATHRRDITASSTPLGLTQEEDNLKTSESSVKNGGTERAPPTVGSSCHSRIRQKNGALMIAKETQRARSHPKGPPMSRRRSPSKNARDVSENKRRTVGGSICGPTAASCDRRTEKVVKYDPYNYQHFLRRLVHEEKEKEENVRRHTLGIGIGAAGVEERAQQFTDGDDHELMWGRAAESADHRIYGSAVVPYSLASSESQWARERRRQAGERETDEEIDEEEARARRMQEREERLALLEEGRSALAKWGYGVNVFSPSVVTRQSRRSDKGTSGYNRSVAKHTDVFSDKWVRSLGGPSDDYQSLGIEGNDTGFFSSNEGNSLGVGLVLTQTHTFRESQKAVDSQFRQHHHVTHEPRLGHPLVGFGEEEDHSPSRGAGYSTTTVHPITSLAENATATFGSSHHRDRGAHPRNRNEVYSVPFSDLIEIRGDAHKEEAPSDDRTPPALPEYDGVNQSCHLSRASSSASDVEEGLGRANGKKESNATLHNAYRQERGSSFSHERRRSRAEPLTRNLDPTRGGESSFRAKEFRKDADTVHRASSPGGVSVSSSLCSAGHFHERLQRTRREKQTREPPGVVHQQHPLDPYHHGRNLSDVSALSISQFSSNNPSSSERYGYGAQSTVRPPANDLRRNSSDAPEQQQPGPRNGVESYTIHRSSDTNLRHNRSLSPESFISAASSPERNLGKGEHMYGVLSSAVSQSHLPVASSGGVGMTNSPSPSMFRFDSRRLSPRVSMSLGFDVSVSSMASEDLRAIASELTSQSSAAVVDSVSSSSGPQPPFSGPQSAIATRSQRDLIVAAANQQLQQQKQRLRQELTDVGEDSFVSGGAADTANNGPAPSPSTSQNPPHFSITSLFVAHPASSSSPTAATNENPQTTSLSINSDMSDKKLVSLNVAESFLTDGISAPHTSLSSQSLLGQSRQPQHQTQPLQPPPPLSSSSRTKSVQKVGSSGDLRQLHAAAIKQRKNAEKEQKKQQEQQQKQKDEQRTAESLGESGGKSKAEGIMSSSTNQQQIGQEVRSTGISTLDKGREREDSAEDLEHVKKDNNNNNNTKDSNESHQLKTTLAPKDSNIDGGKEEESHPPTSQIESKHPEIRSSNEKDDTSNRPFKQGGLGGPLQLNLTNGTTSERELLNVFKGALLSSSPLLPTEKYKESPLRLTPSDTKRDCFSNTPEPSISLYHLSPSTNQQETCMNGSTANSPNRSDKSNLGRSFGTSKSNVGKGGSSKKSKSGTVTSTTRSEVTTLATQSSKLTFDSSGASGSTMIMGVGSRGGTSGGGGDSLASGSASAYRPSPSSHIFINDENTSPVVGGEVRVLAESAASTRPRSPAICIDVPTSSSKANGEDSSRQKTESPPRLPSRYNGIQESNEKATRRRALLRSSSCVKEQQNALRASSAPKTKTTPPYSQQPASTPRRSGSELHAAKGGQASVESQTKNKNPAKVELHVKPRASSSAAKKSVALSPAPTAAKKREAVMLTDAEKKVHNVVQSPARSRLRGDHHPSTFLAGGSRAAINQNRSSSSLSLPTATKLKASGSSATAADSPSASSRVTTHSSAASATGFPNARSASVNSSLSRKKAKK